MKVDTKRDLEKHVFNSKKAIWASQVWQILRFLRFWYDAKKSWFLEAPKNLKNRALSAKARFCGVGLYPGFPGFPRVFPAFPCFRGFVDERVGHKLSNALCWGRHPRYPKKHKSKKKCIGEWTFVDSQKLTKVQCCHRFHGFEVLTKFMKGRYKKGPRKACF